MNKTLTGVIHGKTVELTEDPGIADGEEVEVVVHRVVSKSTREPGDGFLRTEGALADDADWDKVVDELHQARKHERRTQLQGRLRFLDQLLRQSICDQWPQLDTG